MDFKKFYKDCTFELLRDGIGNWDYYCMRYNGRECGVVALAKAGTGAADCHLGSMKYFNKKLSEGVL